MSGLANHSFAGQFDSNSSMEIEGELIEIRWASPHGRLKVRTVDKGKVVVWDLETAVSLRQGCVKVAGKSNGSFWRGQIGGFIIPRHPKMVNCDLGGIKLERVQIIEWIGAGELTGIDETYEDVADARAVLGLIEVEFLQWRIAFFRARSQMLLSSGAPGSRKNWVRACQ
jgi:hypothetical protein